MDSLAGKYHSVALAGSWPKVCARRSIGVTSPSTQSPSGPSVPAWTWMSASAAGEVEASNA